MDYNEEYEKNLKIIRDWKHHWEFKEEGYFERAFGIDSNMVHHLARLLTEAQAVELPLKPGELYFYGTPEELGKIPVRQELAHPWPEDK